jgi:hypothetical protein
MKITKDEARILAASLNDFKYRLNNENNIDGLFDSLEKLELKLEKFGKDKRRTGRTSMDDFSDLLKRL